MTTHEEHAQAVPLEGGGPGATLAAREICQREADTLLLVETLTDCSAEERLVTRAELLERFLERARLAPPVSAAELEQELRDLPDPRFEGPDAESVAQVIKRAKLMKDAIPGTSPDPDAPGIRKTRRMLSRREMLTALLRPREEDAQEAPPRRKRHRKRPRRKRPPRASWTCPTPKRCWTSWKPPTRTWPR